jgi:formate hydrogenlyase transcriptional activator
VLLLGETGTGKELIRSCHSQAIKAVRQGFCRGKLRSDSAGPHRLRTVCHEKGAFTGALQRRLGRFELADGGTLFLDEIGELPMDTQSALLRVLQEGEFERVGGTQTIRADVRVIAETNRDLESAMINGTFCSDLFYRLQVFPIEIRPLRERKEDIPLLVEYFIDRYASKMGKKISGVHRKSLDLLRSCSWPGNIRELQNVIERAVIVCDNDVLSIDESWLSRQSRAPAPSTGTLSKISPDQEKKMISRWLDSKYQLLPSKNGRANRRRHSGSPHRGSTTFLLGKSFRMEALLTAPHYGR